MPKMNEIPIPTYKYDVEILLGYYKEALRKINTELSRLDLTKLDRANITVMQKEIADIILELDDKAKAWVATMLPKAAEDGIVYTLLSLGLAETVAEAQKIVVFNRLNREFVKTAIADMQDDLLQVTQNVERKVRKAVRQVTAEAMRSNLTQGLNTIDAIRPDIMRGLKARLGDALNTGIIDAAGRRWKPEVYVDMVTRTKLAHTQRESAINEAIGRNAFYGMISSHGAKDACRNWEGKIVKLTADAPGDYPYYGVLPNREIFHPNCKHVISPVRRPERIN
ncbi:phage minor capsid protein [Neobacillus sp. 19]|uniref:phage minor capsid protein n=1 Tax=Neobacillus sp. 19 TaxID=3394458 RepID=UPI003BF732B3